MVAFKISSCVVLGVNPRLQICYVRTLLLSYPPNPLCAFTFAFLVFRTGFLCSPGSTGTEACASKALLFIFPKNRVSPCNPVSDLVIFLSSCPCLPRTWDYRPPLPCSLCCLYDTVKKVKIHAYTNRFFWYKASLFFILPPSPVRCLSLSLQGFRRFLDIDIQVWDLSSILWTHTIEEENQLLLTSTDRLCTSDPILTHKTSVNKCNFKNEKVQGLHWPRPVGFLWGANLPHRTLLGHYRAERLVCQDANYHIKTVCSSSKCPHKHLTG